MSSWRNAKTPFMGREWIASKPATFPKIGNPLRKRNIPNDFLDWPGKEKKSRTKAQLSPDPHGCVDGTAQEKPYICGLKIVPEYVREFK
ncbi:MAG: hypothetical protein KDC54_08440 [Lewinella sp.]|nr:hypothetical protein [Lewinella sp.]